MQPKPENDLYNLHYYWLIAERWWPFNRKAYSCLNGRNKERVREFAVSHIHKHVSKTAGQLAAACEQVDHGSPLDLDVLREAAWKLVLAGVRLAQVAGANPVDLASRLSVWAYTEERKQRGN